MCPEVDTVSPVVLMLTSTNTDPPGRQLAYAQDVRVRWIVIDVAGGCGGLIERGRVLDQRGIDGERLGHAPEDTTLARRDAAVRRCRSAAGGEVKRVDDRLVLDQRGVELAPGLGPSTSTITVSPATSITIQRTRRMCAFAGS